jgi:lipid-binding SYLF domain-containing protein
MVERVTERSDGVSAERVTETGGNGTVVVERGGSGAGLLIGLAVLILVIVGAFYLINQNRNDAVRTDAVTSAAQSVGDAAGKVGDSAQKAADDATK